ncbi:MAG: flagellar biosynthesis repressor FlbT [Alphaproteobacteria bacterium]|nr:flagellar biosynthesis repressor FlbT [Alphaproteobacteria bacterium]
MPLKIRVKPEGKIFAGGAVLKNVGRRPAELLILSDSPVLREDYMMNAERRNESDASNVYFLLQVIYLFKGKGQPLDNLVVETLKSFSVLYPHLADHVTEIVRYLEAGEPFKALRLGHKLLAEQHDSENQNEPADAEKQPAAMLATASS